MEKPLQQSCHYRYLSAWQVAGGGGSDSEASATEPTPVPVVSTLDKSKALLASVDAFYATALPDTGAQANKFDDGCLLDGGQNKAYQIKDYDDNLAARKLENAFGVGSIRSNVKVVAERASTNADGTSRLEADITYDIVFKDGTSAIGVESTLVSGSTAGSCATPTNSSDLRFFGNQRKVSVSLQQRNSRTDIFDLATGAPASTPTQLRRDIRFVMRDPANVATYSIVTGPGPKGPGGQAFSLKLLSPRILRDAPELAGKVGNYSNWQDTDTFRFCRIAGSTAVPVAEIADCAAQGATGDNWGFTMSSNLADAAAQKTADTGFAAQGWVPGGIYTFSIYADDGWKTVNGQAGKTPIATYTFSLKRLPYTFVEMYTTDLLANNPDFVSSLTPAELAPLFTGTGGTTTLTGIQARAPAGGLPVALADVFSFGQGVNIGAVGSWPRTRAIEFVSPGSTATTATVPIKGKNPATIAKNFGEINVTYSDRNGGLLLRNWDFQ